MLYTNMYVCMTACMCVGVCARHGCMRASVSVCVRRALMSVCERAISVWVCVFKRALLVCVFVRECVCVFTVY